MIIYKRKRQEKETTITNSITGTIIARITGKTITRRTRITTKTTTSVGTFFEEKKKN